MSKHNDSKQQIDPNEEYEKYELDLKKAKKKSLRPATNRREFI